MNLPQALLLLLLPPRRLLGPPPPGGELGEGGVFVARRGGAGAGRARALLAPPVPAERRGGEGVQITAGKSYDDVDGLAGGGGGETSGARDSG